MDELGGRVRRCAVDAAERIGARLEGRVELES
jgi:hypothetical protein